MKWLKRSKSKKPSLLLLKIEHIEQSLEHIEQALAEQAENTIRIHVPQSTDTDTAPFEPFEEAPNE